ncbi:MAG: NAD(P)/FAD-dependent oxidoreductase, partial [Gammaproteobacteria bacterium]|nr:NAD(P)/FAD-dependent oxidoreductase [Gammaproteobacteria bacterium]
TWNWNQYPGAECDVQSHLYSFSFEQKLDWSQPFAGQQEILEYLNGIADKYDIRRHIRFDTEVERLRWQDDVEVWHVSARDGREIVAQIVVSAIGMFNKIHWPDIPGIEDFKGNYWHSARWNKTHDLAGKRVGVIGMAASAIQLAPEIAPRVDQLRLFQRTANWVVPKANTPYTAAEIDHYRKHPQAVQESREEIYAVWNTLATFSDKEFLANIEKDGLERIAEVKNSATRRKLTPNHPFGCKRPLFSDLYYPIFNRDNVELVTETIASVTATSIITVDGRAHEVDTIIYATGFETTTYLTAIDVTGRDGLALIQAWNDGAQAYLGMSTAGFPNLFMLYGPNTNQGSLLFMFERQCDYIIRQLKRFDDEKLAWMDIRPDVMKAFNDQLQVDVDKIDVWKADCGNDFYHRSASGRFVTGWPHSMDEFTARTSKPNVEAYEVKAAG